MTRVHKNIISLLLGCLISYFSVWLSGIGAAAPVPEFLREYNEFAIYFYSNMVIVLASSILAYFIMVIVRELFILFTKENLFYFALPVILFLTTMLFFMGFATAPLLYAAVPTLVVATLLTKSEK